MSRVMRIAVLTVAACGHPAPPPQPVKPPVVVIPVDAAPPLPLDRDLPRLAQRSSEMLQQLAAAFASAGGDCAAAIARLAELKASYQDVVEANSKVVHEGREQELKAALEPHDAASSAAAKTIFESPTMEKCAADRAFTAAFEDLVAAP